MIRFKIMNLVVYLVQLLLVIPCGWLMKPLPTWLENEHHWHKSIAVGAYILLTALLWLTLVMLILVGLHAIQKRPKH
jgi:membrane protein DedA with SNARE-associated domain